MRIDDVNWERGADDDDQGVVTPPGGEMDEEEEHLEPVKGTEVSLLISGAIAIAACSVFYSLVALLKLLDNGFALYIHRLFYGARPWEGTWAIPLTTTFFFFWAISILFLKTFKLRNEREAFDLDLLPTERARLIRLSDAGEIIRKIGQLSEDVRQKILVNRIWGGLMRLWRLRTSEKVDDMLQYQAVIDANAMESSFAAVKIFIWAIPVFGFIGTVLGISQAIGKFGGIVTNSGDIGEITAGLSQVTDGLGLAFETTLLALVMSVIVMFSTAAVQKLEESFLTQVEEYCLENLLNKVSLARVESDPDRTQRTLQTTLSKTQDKLVERIEKQQQTVVRQLVEEITQQMARNDEARQDEANRALEGTLDNLLQAQASNLADLGRRIERGIGKLSNALETSGGDGAEISSERIEEMLSAALNAQGQKLSDWDTQFSGNVQQMVETLQSHASALKTYTETMDHIGVKEEELRSLQSALDENLASLAAASTFKDILAAIQTLFDSMKPVLEELKKPRQIQLVEESE